ncbi:MAG: hypothetical protein WC069_00640 [Candidatus Shapirobacteria bacterium]
MKSTKKKLVDGGKAIIFDTKPFILYLVGLIFPEKITRFSRTKEFTRDNFRELASLVSQFQNIYLTPYILAEVSHFTLGEDNKEFSLTEKNAISSFLKSIGGEINITEKYLPACTVFMNKHISIIGASDASLLEIDFSNNCLCVTSDITLYQIAKAQGKKVVKLLAQEGIVEY